MVRLFTLVVLIAIASAIGCKSSKDSRSIIRADEIANKELGGKLEKFPNGKYSLYVTSSKTPGVKWKSVLVIELETGDFVFGPKRINGDVSWLSESQLKVIEYPEVIKDKNSTTSYTYVYDLISGAKLESTNSLK